MPILNALALSCMLILLDSPFEPLFESIYIPTLFHSPTLKYIREQSQRSMVANGPLQGRRKGKLDSVPFLLPYENFLGSMVGTSFRIKCAVGENDYGKTYDLVDISGFTTYTAQAYRVVNSS